MGIHLSIECCPRRVTAGALVAPPVRASGDRLLPPPVAASPVRAEAVVAVEPEGGTEPQEEVVSGSIYCQRAGDRHYVIVHCGRRPELVGTSLDLLLDRLPGRILLGFGVYP